MNKGPFVRSNNSSDESSFTPVLLNNSLSLPSGMECSVVTTHTGLHLTSALAPEGIIKAGQVRQVCRCV